MKDTVKVCNFDDLSNAGELMDNPTVTCGRCGMKAHDAANVCDPKYDKDIHG